MFLLCQNEELIKQNMFNNRLQMQIHQKADTVVDTTNVSQLIPEEVDGLKMQCPNYYEYNGMCWQILWHISVKVQMIIFQKKDNKKQTVKELKKKRNRIKLSKRGCPMLIQMKM